MQNLGTDNTLVTLVIVVALAGVWVRAWGYPPRPPTPEEEKRFVEEFWAIWERLRAARRARAAAKAAGLTEVVLALDKEIIDLEQALRDSLQAYADRLDNSWIWLLENLITAAWQTALMLLLGALLGGCRPWPDGYPPPPPLWPWENHPPIPEAVDYLLWLDRLGYDIFPILEIWDLYNT